MTEIPYDDRLGADLRTAALHTRRSAEGIRKGLIAAIRRAVGARVVLYLGYAEAGAEGVVCTGVLRVGTREDAAAIELEGQPSPLGADAVRRPDINARNRFTWLDISGGLPRCLVATFFAGDEVLGSLAVVMGDRPSGRRLVPALDAAAGQFAAALRRAADLADDEWVTGATAAFVVRPDGTVGESTSPATRHLLGRRGERLEARVRDAIHDGGPRRFACDGAWVSVEPLIGAGSASFLVSLVQVERPRLAMDHALTPRQREVCALYVQHLSSSRIAKQLGLTARSVQRLLKQSFDRLGVNELSALRALLAEPMALVTRAAPPRSRPLAGGPARQMLLERARRGLLQKAGWA